MGLLRPADPQNVNYGAVIIIMIVVLGTPIGYLIRRAHREEKEQSDAAIVAERERRSQEQAAEQKRLAESELRQIRDSEARKQQLRNGLSLTLKSSRSDLQNLPTLLTDADADLNLADDEFAEKAAISFWDAVERATNCLARYQAGLQNLTVNGTSYEKMRNELGEPVAPYDLNLSILPDASPTAQRLRSVARKGETDLAFAQIYLQMRTNKILVAGFSTLGGAISILGDRIEESFANLSNVVEFSTASQTEAINARQTELAEAERQHQSQIAADQRKDAETLNKSVKEADDAARQAAQEQSKRDREDSKKLGDIQRGRKPLGWGHDDGDERWRRPRP